MNKILRNEFSKVTFQSWSTFMHREFSSKRACPLIALWLIDFTNFPGSWCGPCKLLAPRLESTVGLNKEVHLAKINVDDNDVLAERYEVHRKWREMFLRINFANKMFFLIQPHRCHPFLLWSESRMARLSINLWASKMKTKSKHLWTHCVWNDEKVLS